MKFFTFGDDSLTFSDGVPSSVWKVVTLLFQSINAPDHAQLDVESWASYARGLIPLRLPLIMVKTAAAVEEEGDLAIFSSVAMRDLVSASNKNLRPAILEELWEERFIYSMINDASSGRESNFIEPPPKPPADADTLIISYAIWMLDKALGDKLDGEAMYRKFASAAAILGACGKKTELKTGEKEIVAKAHNAATNAANARWSRLDQVKELAFQRRRDMPPPKFSRAEAIRRMTKEIVEASRVAGEPLTGADPGSAITGWFRKAGIK